MLLPAYQNQVVQFPYSTDQNKDCQWHYLLLLDLSEADTMLKRHIRDHLRDTLNGLLTTLAEQKLSSWLTLFKEVLTTSADTTAGPVQPGQHGQPTAGFKSSSTADADGEGAVDDDEEEFHANGNSLSESFAYS